MRQELKNTQRIEDYLLGQFSEEEALAIETEMANNPEFKAKVEQHKLVMRAVKRKAIRKEVAKVSASGNSISWNWGLGKVLVIVVTLAAAAALIAILDFSDKEETVKQDEFTFHGLKTWVEPHVQHFNIIADSGATIEGKKGILVIVPDSAFLDSNGNIVSGAVDFELVEALTLESMILYNLTTVSDGKPLETGGMFYINATQNGAQLLVNPKRPLYIEIPTNDKKEGMMAFKGEVTSEGSINWTDPVALKKFLALVDFDYLDFLPPGFEDEVRKEPKNSPFYLETKEQIDSLYYSIPFEKQGNKKMKYRNLSYVSTTGSDSIWVYEPKTRKLLISYREGDPVEEVIEKLSFKETDSRNFDTTDNCGGIDPLTINTIRSKTFASTFIATKEFEQRIKALHKSEAGEELVQFYVGNLSKDLWEIDSMVANNLYGNDKAIFESFKQQKHTNIKDAEIYQERLSANYNAKKEASHKALQGFKDNIAQKNQSELNALKAQLVKLEQSSSLGVDKQTTSAIRKTVISGIPARSAATTSVYAIQWYSFGWANIDRYLKYVNDSSKQVRIIAKTDEQNVKIYQWLGIINTLTPIQVSGNKGTAVFPDEKSEAAAKMKHTQAIAIAQTGNQFSWGHITYNPYQNDSVEIILDTVTIEDLKQQLARLNIGTGPLTERIDKALEMIEAEKERKRAIEVKLKELRKKKADLEAQQKFECRLREICFGCQCAPKAQEEIDESEGKEEIIDIIRY
ncbi:hypothetical protein OAO55_00580 [Bacteroidales bacterium]|nr:hypothetical protein [Bacteroidales bacterium]